MLIDLLSTTNYVSYNIRIAHIVGLHPAIYLAELININNQHIRSDSPDSACSFEINRSYMQSITTFEEDEQVSIEETLKKLGILIEFDIKSNLYQLDLQAVYNLIASTDEASLKKIKKVAASKSTKPKISARQKQCDELKANINCSDSTLTEAYRDWVDGVYANPKGFLSSKAIAIFQKTVKEFSKGDIDLMKKIIDIATVNGYRDATWAINVFNKDYAAHWNKVQNSNSPSPRARVNLSGEVF